jgi:hypothetical protein
MEKALAALEREWFRELIDMTWADETWPSVDYDDEPGFFD